MADDNVCDQCGKTERDGRSLDWWSIEPRDEWLRRIDMTDPPWHLCSWACVAAFAEKQQPDVDGEDQAHG